MSVWLRTSADAVAVADRFNGFHDGFIQSLTLISHDRFTAGGPAITDIGHEVSGSFEVGIEFSHYNYGQGTQPMDRIVRARFFDAARFAIDLRQHSAEQWPITAVDFPPVGDRFAFSIIRSRLDDGIWTRFGEVWFTFGSAELTEA